MTSPHEFPSECMQIAALGVAGTLHEVCANTLINLWHSLWAACGPSRLSTMTKQHAALCRAP